jgi:hypothetical protein
MSDRQTAPQGSIVPGVPFNVELLIEITSAIMAGVHGE